MFACLARPFLTAWPAVYVKRRITATRASAIALYSQLTAAAVLAPRPLRAVAGAADATSSRANALALALASTALATCSISG